MIELISFDGLRVQVMLRKNQVLLLLRHNWIFTISRNELLTCLKPNLRTTWLNKCLLYLISILVWPSCILDATFH
jgi:hypothetical protein